jgi:hypothetical protein
MTKTAGQLLYEASPEAQHQAPWSSLPHWHRAELQAVAARRIADDALIDRCAAAAFACACSGAGPTEIADAVMRLKAPA